MCKHCGKHFTFSEQTIDLVSPGGPHLFFVTSDPVDE